MYFILSKYVIEDSTYNKALKQQKANVILSIKTSNKEAYKQIVGQALTLWYEN